MKQFFIKALLLVTFICFVGEQMEHLLMLNSEKMELVEKELEEETEKTEKEERNPKTILEIADFQFNCVRYAVNDTLTNLNFSYLAAASTACFEVPVPPPDWV